MPEISRRLFLGRAAAAAPAVAAAITAAGLPVCASVAHSATALTAEPGDPVIQQIAERQTFLDAMHTGLDVEPDDPRWPAFDALHEAVLTSPIRTPAGALAALQFIVREGQDFAIDRYLPLMERSVAALGQVRT